MLISICGTPGVGKTTVARMLVDSGYEVFNEKDLIEDLSLFDERDAATGELIVDVEKVAEGFRTFFHDKQKDNLIDGHLSYLAPYDILIILRLDPDHLRKRLMTRDYSEKKIDENVEAEVLSSVLINSIKFGSDPGDRMILERDITGMAVDEIVKWILEMVSAWKGKKIKTLSIYSPGKVDWLEAYSKWS